MTKEFYDHIETNLPTFNMWIENHSRLQISNDIFLPLIPVFQEANPTVNLNACQDCIIDMLIWCRMQYKQHLFDIGIKAASSIMESFSEKLEEAGAKIEKTWEEKEIEKAKRKAKKDINKAAKKKS
jgi:hypothetical protein